MEMQMDRAAHRRRGSPEEGTDDAGMDTTTAAAKLGKLGGIARRKNLTAEKRREIAQKAAAARWEKKDAE
jgi:hypothetical protein